MANHNNIYRFYYLSLDRTVTPPNRMIASRVAIWQSGKFKVMPPKFPLFPYIYWWIFKKIKLLRNDYIVAYVMNNYDVIHRSIAVTKYFRFPFMDEQDIQIGYVFTDKKYRNLGYAKEAIHSIINFSNGKYRGIWYVTSNDNLSSRLLAESSGFHLVGKGKRIKGNHYLSFARYVIE